ncbi:MAG TPA: hypothetical protein DCG75_09000 [Bacteroidales bacterium]|nr:hypothetical protein [Bacteroidales bacterium]
MPNGIAGGLLSFIFPFPLRYTLSLTKISFNANCKLHLAPFLTANLLADRGAETLRAPFFQL